VIQDRESEAERRFDVHLIAGFSVTFRDGICAKLEHTSGTKVGPRYGEGPNSLVEPDDFLTLVDQENVESEEHADCMDRVGRQNPDAHIGLEGSPAEQSVHRLNRRSATMTRAAKGVRLVWL